MNTTKKIALFSLLLAGKMTFAQQWTGTAPGPISTTSTFVGIGTPVPATLLHVSNSSGFGSIYIGANASTGHYFTHETSDHSFNLWSGTMGSGTNRMKLTESGNIGIGKSPYYKLDVAGTIYADQGGLLVSNSTSEGGYVGIFNHTKNGTYMRNYAIYNMNGMYGSRFSIWGYSADGTINVERFNIWDNGDFGFHNITGTEVLRMTNAGNIGIGTATPSEKLHVNGLLRVNAASTTDNDSPGLTFVSDDDFLYDGEYLNHYGLGAHGYNDGNGLNGLNVYTSGYYGLDFFTAGLNRLRINHNGNIGIGTASPLTKLHVNGSGSSDAFVVSNGTTAADINFKVKTNGAVFARELNVQLGTFPDYVFAKDYQLMPLQKLDNYIQENKHLPNIPAANEVVTNGMNVGEMQKLQMEKIEELTLYLIEQNKLIEALKKEVEELKNAQQ